MSPEHQSVQSHSELVSVGAPRANFSQVEFSSSFGEWIQKFRTHAIEAAQAASAAVILDPCDLPILAAVSLVIG